MSLYFCVTYSGVNGASLEKGEATTENRMKEEAIFFFSIPRRAQESG